MISKLFKSPVFLKGLAKPRLAYFADDKGQKPPQKPQGQAQKQGQPQKPKQSEQPKQAPPSQNQIHSSSQDHSHSAPSASSTSSNPYRLDKISYLQYKKWPNLPHNDPTSKEYVHSERDEYHDKAEIDAYNYIIDGIKRDLKIQDEVYEVLRKADRPYKRGVHGIHQNIRGGVRDYFPQGDLGYKTGPEDLDTKFLNDHFRNEDRWTNQTIFHPKYHEMQHIAEWKKDLANRPLNKHYHPDKGYKYDVEVPYDQRFPHVADRMGHPEIMGTPFERLLKLEGEIYHPVYLDQPFVQVPKPEPDPSLNFEEGEVIYENTQFLEWARFWSLTTFSSVAFLGLFCPYSLIFKTHLPLPSAMEGQWVPYQNLTFYNFDNPNVSAPVVAFAFLYVMHAFFNYNTHFWGQYALKMQYNKDKELLFVTRFSPMGQTEEDVYEVQHLEIPPPSVKVGTKDLSSQDEDGLWDINCMATHKSIVVYNEDRYWNAKLKKEFFDKVMNYWSSDIVKGSRMEEELKNRALPKISPHD